MRLKIGLLLLLLLCRIAGGAEAAHTRFASGAGDLAGWETLALGDGGGSFRIIDAELGGSYRQVLLLDNPAERSWSFLRRQFPAAAARQGEVVRAWAWVRTNAPERLRLILNEGPGWGEAAPAAFRETRAGGTANRRVRMSVELPRSFPDKAFGVALGFDYESPGCWAVIDEIAVEVASPGAAAPEAPASWEDYERIYFPADWAIRTEFPEPAVLAARRERETRRYREAGLAEHPAVRRRLERLERLTACLTAAPEVRAARMVEAQELAHAVEQERLFWRLADDAAAFARDTVTVPESPERLDWTLCGNDADSRLLQIVNMGEAPENVRLAVTGDAAGLLRISRLFEVAGVPDLPLEQPPEVPIVVDGESLVGIALECRTAGVAPGCYEGVLELIPANADLEVRRLPLRITVADYELPPSAPLAVFTSEYNAAADPRKRDLLLAARVNVFNVALRGPDFEELRAVVTSLNRRLRPGEYQLLIEVWFVRDAGGWRDGMDAWLDRLVAETAALGLGYGDWMLHMYDEVLNDEFIAAARAVKARDPQVRIFSDHITADPGPMERIRPFIDLWCPAEGCLDDGRYQQAWRLMRDSGYPIWCYTAGSTPEQPLRFYRALPYQAWLHRLDGIYKWAALTSEVRTRPGAQNYGMFYAGGDGRWLPSRRFRQLAYGIGDYLLLEAVAGLDREKATELARDVCRAADGEAFAAAVANARRTMVEMLAR